MWGGGVENSTFTDCFAGIFKCKLAVKKLKPQSGGKEFCGGFMQESHAGPPVSRATLAREDRVANHVACRKVHVTL